MALTHNAFFSQAAQCLAISDPHQKCQAVAELWDAISRDGLDLDVATPVTPIGDPGRPAKPELVAPSALKRRKLGSEQGRATLIHAIAHIEFNAINLALDAAFRFRDMPHQYYLDWWSVAVDEARHFQLLSDRLQSLGYQYGDFPAHNGLWEMAQRTADDVMKRMALVPRVLEARGLDVTPGMIDRLSMVGDDQTISILEIILEEEVRHVEIGSQWFRYCCELRGLEPEPVFLELLKDYFKGPLRGPFNIPARMKAGFSEAEMRAIEAIGE